jgi:hypothetical protein
MNVVDDNHRDDIRDLGVEPVTVPGGGARFRESVFAPWAAASAADGAIPEYYWSGPLDETSYSEWQFAGSSSSSNDDDGDGDGDGDGDDAASLDRVMSLLLATSSTPPEASSPPASDATKRLLLAFLFGDDGSAVRVLWLSRARFLVCHGPRSDPLDDFWYIFWASGDNMALEARFDTTSAAVAAAPAAPAAITNEGEFRYVFRIGRVPGAVPAASIEGDRWPAAVALLLSHGPEASAFGCRLPPGPDNACLEALVEWEPPPPPSPRGGGTRPLVFDHVTEEATACIIARQTHPRTAVVVNVDAWGEGGVAVLAAAMLAHQCPERLILERLDRGSRSKVEILARALRATTAVKELQVAIPSPTGQHQPADPGCCAARLLLGAIRGNVGLVTLVSARQDIVSSSFLKEFWTSVLASRTLRRVEATEMTSDPFLQDGESEECARHVVALLRTNRVVIDLRYNRHSLDAAIVEAEAVPILHLNRLRHVAVEAASAADDANRGLVSLFGSALVRQRPMMTYYLVRSNVDTLALHLLLSTSSEQPWDGRLRKRPRPAS